MEMGRRGRGDPVLAQTWRNGGFYGQGAVRRPGMHARDSDRDMELQVLCICSLQGQLISGLSHNQGDSERDAFLQLCERVIIKNLSLAEERGVATPRLFILTPDTLVQLGAWTRRAAMWRGSVWVLRHGHNGSASHEPAGSTTRNQQGANTEVWSESTPQGDIRFVCTMTGR